MARRSGSYEGKNEVGLRPVFLCRKCLVRLTEEYLCTDETAPTTMSESTVAAPNVTSGHEVLNESIPLNHHFSPSSFHPYRTKLNNVSR